MPRIRPAKFVHVVYRTRRFEEMIRWYEAVFDAKVQHRNPVLAFLTYDDEHHRFAFVNLAVLQREGTDTDRQGSIGVDHVAYAYRSLSELFDKTRQEVECSRFAGRDIQPTGFDTSTPRRERVIEAIDFTD